MRYMARLLSFGLVLSLSLSAARRGAFLDAVREADSIVLGEVITTNSYYGSDGEIYTDVVLQVRSKVKDRAGRVPGTLTFTVPGGQVGDTRVEFSETPAFADKEAVMLMLDANGQPAEKLELDGDYLPELGKSASVALDEIVAAGEALPEFQPERAKEFARKSHRPGKIDKQAAAAAPIVCHALMGPKWSPGTAGFKVASTIPAAWSTSLAGGVNAWNQGGSPFRFTTDANSANEITLATIAGASNILAQTRVEYMPSTNTIRRFTLTFSSAHQWSTTGEASKFDVQGIAAHELGHALGLNHPSDASCNLNTMWASAAAGETIKRTLEAGDKAGLVALYGSAASTTPPPAPTPATPVTPPPPPAPAPITPALSTVNVLAAPPCANQGFYLIANGAAFEKTLQFVITGPGCPTGGCVVAGNMNSATFAHAITRLRAGAFTVAVRNTATGMLSALKAITVTP